MQNVSTQRAGDLPRGVKSAVERLLGRQIGADEEVGLVAARPRQIPPSQSREAVAQKLETFLNRRAATVGDISDEDLDAVVDDAVDFVRHSRK